MALLDGLAERARGLEDRRRAARRIHRSVDPGVEVIAEDYELQGLLAAPDHADDAAHPRDALVVLHVHLDRHRARPEAIGDRQASLPVVRRPGAAQTLQDLSGVALVERHRRNLRQLLVARRAFSPAAVRLLLPVERERLALAEP